MRKLISGVGISKANPDFFVAANTIDGTTKNDVIEGTAESDTINGLGGSDRLSGRGGDDVLDGGEGDDWLQGGAGTDRLIGGLGYDYASFETTSLSVAVTLAVGASATVTIGGVAADTIESCEGIIGGTGDDRLIFTGLYRYAPASVYGGAGDDLLCANYVDGGDGFDTLDLSNVGDYEFSYWSVSLDRDNGSWGSSPLRSVEGVIGRELRDTILGSHEADVVDGAGGDDYIAVRDAETGRDIARGGAGNDRIDFLGSSAELYGDEGDDSFFYGGDPYRMGGTFLLLDGGTGTDTFSVSTRDALTIDLTATTFALGSHPIGTFQSIERVFGGEGADSIKGTDDINELSGGGGADVLVGRGGDDLLRADATDGKFNRFDLLTGGAGADTFQFVRFGAELANTLDEDRITDFAAKRGDRIDLSQVDGNVTNSKYDSLAFIGTRSFTGNAAELRCEIVDGETRLIANVDGDIDGEWILHLDGEHEIRFGDLIGVLDGVQDRVIVGTAYGDTLNGTDADDVIQAGGGDDVVFGADGDDQLLGESGDDVLIGSQGRDLLDGGKGRDDFADYSAEVRNISITFKGRKCEVLFDGVGEDTLKGIEGVRGGAGDDRLIGMRAGVSGGTGDDYIEGYFQQVDGGAGNDTFGATFSTYYWWRCDLSAGTVTMSSSFSSSTEAFTGIENVTILSGQAQILGTDGVNRLIGGEGDDYLDGRGAVDGRDFLSGGAGSDRLVFGGGDADLFGGTDYDLFVAEALSTGRVTIDAGSDTGNGIDFRAVDEQVTLDLSAGSFAVSGGASGTMSGITNAFGGAEADVIRGDDAANDLGGAGDSDRLTGGGGADRFYFDNRSASTSNKFDRITDFSQAEGDKISLFYVYDNKTNQTEFFKFIGTEAFSGESLEVRFRIDGGTTWIEGDTDRNGVADMLIRLDGAIDLVAADFVTH